MIDIYILKLGGSAITFKGKSIPEPNLSVIQNAINDIKNARAEREFQLIVIHGAGPYGHRFVADFGIGNGLKNTKDVEGFVKTHQSMEELNKIIVDSLNEAGLLAFPIQPSACIVQKNKKISFFNLEIIKALLQLDNDVIPILYGDMVIDEELKASVVSGDAIISFLARNLPVKKIFFGTDVTGIFTYNPKNNRHTELIPQITAENVDRVLQQVSGANNIDVTGGMKGKLNEILNISKNRDIYIFNMTKKGNLFNLFLGNKLECTEIKIR